jgi:toxin ParE1/3/4
MEIRFRPAANSDLDDILLYIARDNPDAALKVVNAIETFCFEKLSDNPQIGSSRDDLIKGLKIFPIYSYLVCYFVRKDHIDIARIVHGAQDYKRLL